MERVSVKGRWAAVVFVLAALVLGGAALARARTHRVAAPGAPIPEQLHAPAGQRIRVQVLNATKTRNLARRATMLLRDRGFDVVDLGTASAMRDTTLILDLSGHPEWARLVSAIFNGAPVTALRDRSRYLDIAVLIGASWRPPAEPFYP